jgi:hypothetical protein
MTKKSLLPTLAGIIFFFAFVPNAAQASYDRKCLEILANIEPTSMDDYRKTWTPFFRQVFSSFAPLDGPSYEAAMDLFHGFSITVTFADGTKTSFRGADHASMQTLFTKLESTSVDAVQFSAADLAKLGQTLKDACIALRRAHCDVYANYPGLVGGGRPLTLAEERVVKWATFHMTPVDSMVDMLRDAPDQKHVREAVEEGRTEKLVHAYNLLGEQFSPADAVNLYEDFVGPFIEAGFDRLMSLYNRELRH